MKHISKILTVLMAVSLCAACMDDRSIIEDIEQASDNAAAQQQEINLDTNVPVVDGMELEGVFKIIAIYMDTDESAEIFRGDTIYSDKLVSVDGSTDGVVWDSEERPEVKIYDKNNYSKIVFKSNGTFALRYKFVNEKNKTVQLGDLDYGMQYGYYDVYESVASFEVTGKHPYGVVDSSITDYNVEVYGDIVVLRAIDQNQDVGDFVMIHAEKL